MRLRNVKNKEEILSSCNILIRELEDLKGKWKEKFNNDNPIYIEIGMGKGDFIIQNAIEYPNINFIGIEKYDSVISRAVQKVPEGINNLLLIQMEEEFGIAKLYDAVKMFMPENVIPFARDGFDNYICFDYRENESAPTVVFWDYEKACIEYNNSGNTGSSLNYDNAITYICDSFTELLDMLHEPEEE